MKKIFFIFFILVMLPLIQANYQTYYKLNLQYDNGDLELVSTEVIFSHLLKANLGGVHSVVLVDYEGNIINEVLFNIPNIILWDGVDEDGLSIGGEMALNQTNFDIYLPYNETAKEIIINYKQDLIKQDISKYNKKPFELSVTKEGESSDFKSDFNEKNFIKTLSDYWWVLAILLLILLVIFLRGLKKDEKN